MLLLVVFDTLSMAVKPVLLIPAVLLVVDFVSLTNKLPSIEAVKTQPSV